MKNDLTLKDFKSDLQRMIVANKSEDEIIAFANLHYSHILKSVLYFINSRKS